MLWQMAQIPEWMFSNMEMVVRSLSLKKQHCWIFWKLLKWVFSISIHTASRAHPLYVQGQWVSANAQTVFNIPTNSLKSPQNWRKQSNIANSGGLCWHIFVKLGMITLFFKANARSNCQYLLENFLQGYGFYYLSYE